MTSGSLLTSSGVPTQMVLPKFSTVTWSHRFETTSIWCSIIKMVISKRSRICRTKLTSSADSSAFIPAAGSSSSSSLGSSAMALDPKLLLLDEPAAGMNAEESAELVSFVRQIRDRFDITILMIEHHMDVVSNLCDHVTVLNFGKTICVGTPEEVKSDPEVIRAYLGGE